MRWPIAVRFVLTAACCGLLYRHGLFGWLLAAAVGLAFIEAFTSWQLENLREVQREAVVALERLDHTVERLEAIEIDRASLEARARRAAESIVATHSGSDMSTAPATLHDTGARCSLCGLPFKPNPKRLRFCSKRCSGKAAAMRHERPLAQRFADKVDRKGDDECWPWIGCRDSKGYGRVQRGGRGSPARAHRIAFELTFGTIPRGASVCHRCDNPPCCNPGHLFVGENAENVQDKLSKDRQAKGSKTAHAGECHHSAKLTDAAVREIRLLAASGRKQKDIAEHFGIRQNTVSRIVSGKSWSHVS